MKNEKEFTEFSLNVAKHDLPYWIISGGYHKTINVWKINIKENETKKSDQWEL